MYLIRDVFKAKPGKAKQLIEIFKSTSGHFLSDKVRNIRVLSDMVAGFWTVVWEFEVEQINDYFEMSKNVDSDANVFDSMEGYKEHVLEGHREIFKIESSLG